MIQEGGEGGGGWGVLGLPPRGGCIDMGGGAHHRRGTHPNKRAGEKGGKPIELISCCHGQSGAFAAKDHKGRAGGTADKRRKISLVMKSEYLQR